MAEYVCPPTEKFGKKLLVGRYVLYNHKVAYVRAVHSNGTVDIVETQAKKDRTIPVNHPHLQLIENFGVNIFKLD